MSYRKKSFFSNLRVALYLKGKSSEEIKDILQSINARDQAIVDINEEVRQQRMNVTGIPFDNHYERNVARVNNEFCCFVTPELLSLWEK